MFYAVARLLPILFLAACFGEDAACRIVRQDIEKRPDRWQPEPNDRVELFEARCFRFSSERDEDVAEISTEITFSYVLPGRDEPTELDPLIWRVALARNDQGWRIGGREFVREVVPEGSDTGL